jgi:chaperonin GroEL
MIKATDVITDRDVLQEKISNASDKVYAVAKAAYGPKAGNVIIGFKSELIALEYIDSIKKNSTDEHLQKVATVSAGDPELGAMIADILQEVGVDGGVVIEQYEGLGVHNEIVDGFYFPRGYKDTALINDQSSNQSLHSDVAVLISNKVFNTEVELAPVINDVVRAGYKELIIVGEVNNAALETLIMTRAKGLLLAVPVDPPYTVGGRTLFLDDIAIKTGAKVYDGVNFSIEEHLGFAKEVLVTEHSTTIIDGDSEKELVSERINSLKTQLKDEEHPQSIQFIKDRLARLTGKMAIIRVGGAIEFEREEVKLRVQDAVCAVQSAMKDGILPGGGSTLARVKGTEFDDAFKQPFKALFENAGLNPEEYIARLDDKDVWKAFNLRNITDKPVDMLEEGVIDPSLVISEVVTNAVALVRGLITASAALPDPEKE